MKKNSPKKLPKRIKIKQNTNKKITLISIVAIFILILSMTYGYFYLQNRENAPDIKKDEIEQIQNNNDAQVIIR